MANLGYSLAVIFTVILANSIQQAFALKCWNCDSDMDRFCGDRFDHSMITDQDRRSSYYECPGLRCVKVVYNIGILQMVHRLCANDDYDAKYVCDNLQQGSRCETCSTDGCNGVAQLAPITLITLVPVAIAKLLLHYVP